jgi:hypothetical protein
MRSFCALITSLGPLPRSLWRECGLGRRMEQLFRHRSGFRMHCAAIATGVGPNLRSAAVFEM